MAAGCRQNRSKVGCANSARRVIDALTSPHLSAERLFGRHVQRASCSALGGAGLQFHLFFYMTQLCGFFPFSLVHTRSLSHDVYLTDLSGRKKKKSPASRCPHQKKQICPASRSESASLFQLVTALRRVASYWSKQADLSWASLLSGLVPDQSSVRAFVGSSTPSVNDPLHSASIRLRPCITHVYSVCFVFCTLEP